MTMPPVSLANVDLSRIEVPDWARTWLFWGGTILAAIVALYVGLSVLRYFHRRAYNLTKAETARAAKGNDPAFLKVDHEARAAAIQRGDAYVRPADREAVDAAAAKGKGSIWTTVCRVSAVIAGIAHIAIFLGTVLARSEQAERGWSNASAMERLQELFSRYWLGLLLATLVIAATVIHALATRKKSA